MGIRNRLLGLTLSAVMLALLPAAAQRGPAAMPLTADDHMQIQQLVTRFGYALDTGANDGAMFADLFTEDGVYGAAKGRTQLAALARTLGANGELEAAARRYEDAAALDSTSKAKDRLARVKTAIAQNKNLNNKEKNAERDAQSKLASEAENAGKFELAAEHYGRAAALSSMRDVPEQVPARKDAA